MTAAGPLLLSFATTIERDAVLGRTRSLPVEQASVVVTGPGQGAVENLVDWPGFEQLAGIFVLGVAGALRGDLQPGQLLLPAAVVGPDGDREPANPAWHAQLLKALAALAPLSGQLLSTPAPVSEPAERERLQAAHDCIAVDMETLAIARAARARGIPWLGLRSVADPAGQPLPAAALAAFDATGRLATGRLATRLLLAPGDWPALWHLRRQFAIATDSLRAALRLAGAALWPPATD